VKTAQKSEKKNERKKKWIFLPILLPTFQFTDSSKTIVFEPFAAV